MTFRNFCTEDSHLWCIIYCIGGDTIQSLSQQKDLSIIVTDTLSWSVHTKQGHLWKSLPCSTYTCIHMSMIFLGRGEILYYERY